MIRGPSVQRVGRRPIRFRWLLLMLLAAAAFAVVASRPDPPPNVQPTGDAAMAEQTIEAQLDPKSGRDPLATIPADFTRVTGNHYERLRAPDGTVRAVNPEGGCSSPWGDTRWDYGAGCKAHDLGYDLLRYAAAKGQPLSADLRERLDDRLSMDMHAQCTYNPQGSPRSCEVVASLYTVGLVVNSWHQQWGPPRLEPVGPWSVAMVVIMLLIAARAPALARRGTPVHRQRRRGSVELTATERAQGDYLGILRVVSITGIVLAESLLAFTMRGTAEPGWVWPLTWLLQLVPLFFFAGGHANLLAWRACRQAGGGYTDYLVDRIGWLIRPTLAFVIAWLVIPLSLELLRAPEPAVAAFSRLIVQPLWLLGLYVVVVAATPLLHRLHRAAPIGTPLALLAGVVGLGLLNGSLAAHAGGVLVAWLFAQLSFHYADGRLWRLPRWALLAVAAGAFAGLIAITTLGTEPLLQLAEPSPYAAFAPSALGVLLIGVAQVCLTALPREPKLRTVAASRPARAVAVVRAAPMTAYLVYLCAMLLLEGIVGVARRAGVTTDGFEWLTEPRTILALGMLAMPTLLAFLWFERRTAAPAPVPADEEAMERSSGAVRVDTVAAGLGVLYGALGVLGFAVTGLGGWSETSVLFGLPIDPMANLIHLLLGWYLLHTVHLQTSARSGPWLVTAIACVPPILTTFSGVGIVVHGVTMAIALVLAVLCLHPPRPARKWFGTRAPVPVGSSAGR